MTFACVQDKKISDFRTAFNVGRSDDQKKRLHFILSVVEFRF